MSEKLLCIKNLKTYFFTESGVVKAVDGLNLEIGEGETVGVVGETGCGKTVTALSVLRLIPNPPGRIVDGSIFFEGKDLVKLTEDEMRKIRGNRIAMIFQEPTLSLNPLLICGEQVGESLKLHQKVGRRDSRKKVFEMLNLVGLPDVKKTFYRYPHELSGGMQQRIMIAMALSCNPKLLIADEPTTALDVTMQAQILELMRELQKRLSSSIMLVTHDLGIVADICDKVAVMYAGRIVEFGDVITIYEDHKHPYVEGLLESLPTSSKEEGRLRVIPGFVPDMINPPSGCRFHPRCPYAKSICREEIPESIEVERGHIVSCHLYQ